MDELNDFLTKRLHNMNSERALFEVYISDISPSHQEIHNLEWEIEQRKNVLVVGERELNSLSVELDRISEMLRLKDSEVPLPILQLSDQSVNVIDNREGMSIVRNGEIVALETKLASITAVLESNMAAIADCMNDTKSNWRRHITSLKNKIEVSNKETFRCVEELGELELQNHAATAELLSLRHETMIAQREELEDKAQLQEEKIRFMENLRAAESQVAVESEVAKMAAYATMVAERADYSRQLEKYRQEREELVERLQASQKRRSGDGKLKVLEREVKEAKAKYEKLRRRHALEMEGYCNEARMLRQRLKSVEKNVFGLS